MAQGKPFTIEDRERIIRSLQPYLELGYSRNKACGFIGLAPTTLSEWVKDNDALRIELHSWENTVNTIVIANLVDAIKQESTMQEDTKKENSWKWAQSRMKDDFSNRTESTGPEGTPLIPESTTNDAVTALANMLNEQIKKSKID